MRSNDSRLVLVAWLFSWMLELRWLLKSRNLMHASEHDFVLGVSPEIRTFRGSSWEPFPVSEWLCAPCAVTGWSARRFGAQGKYFELKRLRDLKSVSGRTL